VVWSDFNNDGRVDCIVPTMDAQLSYRNDGDGHFTEVAYCRACRQPGWTEQANMGLALVISAHRLSSIVISISMMIHRVIRND